MNTYTEQMHGNQMAAAMRMLPGAEADLSPSGQRDRKPRIDSAICHFLDGEPLKNALSFIECVRGARMKIKWAAPNVWSVKHKGKRVLDIVLKDGFWGVRLVYENAAQGYALTNASQEKLKAAIRALREHPPSGYLQDAAIA